MRELSFIISNLIEILQAQNATKKQIKRACNEVIDGLNDPVSENCYECDMTRLKSYPISFCKKCGFILPY